jgi:UDP-glucose 4-epimerase
VPCGRGIRRFGAPRHPVSTAAVFGAGGKIGRAALALLARRGYAARVLQHRTPIAGPGITAVRGSIVDPAAVAATVAGADVVLQLATTKEDAETFFDVSIRGTFQVLEACRQQRVRQFLLIGGDAALGIWFHPRPVPLDENHPHAAYPGGYAFSKVIEEVMAGQYAHQYGLPVTVLRSSWVFTGDDLLRHFSLLRNVRPGEPGHGFGEVDEEVLQRVRAGREHVPVLLDAGGRPLRRHIVHLDDVIHALDRALGNPSALGGTFNIAGPAPFDYRVAAEHLAGRLGLPTIDLRCPRYHSFEININRARSVLGYAPENDFFRMADRAIAAAHEARQG